MTTGRIRAALPFLLASVAWCRTAVSPDDQALARSLATSYNRCSSRVMVRVLTRTDRATLDHATHDRNVVFHYPLDETLQRPVAPIALSDLLFNGTLHHGTLADAIGDTPLTEAETAGALAWRPLLKYLTEWNYDACEALLDAGAAVSGVKWGNADLIRPLQEIAAAYRHGNDIWVRIDFRPELARWLPVEDSDGDGYPECYGRLAKRFTNPKVLTQIAGDYAGRPLTSEEREAYFYSLASEWYPSLMTVVLEPEQSRPWPGKSTEPEIRKALGGRSFANPLAVLRSKPYGTTLYSVFLLAAGDRSTQRTAAPGGAPTEPRRGRATPSVLRDATAGQPLDRLVQQELRNWGGSWDAWCAELAPFHTILRDMLKARPRQLNGLIGRDGFLFFRRDVDFLLSGDLRKQRNGRDPFPAIVDFSRQLRGRGIDCLLVTIPTKAEVYPDKLAKGAPNGATPYIAPYGRKLLAELAAEGVECVDLLPAFIEHRYDAEGLLYMPQDTHWTPRGLELAAAMIAERVRRYPWYPELETQRQTYTTRTASFTRLGDICAMLTDAERRAYRPMALEAHQVLTRDGTPYTDRANSPIAMLGDSFTSVFQLEDCRHAGLSAHVARETGIPVDLMMAHGSGPQIRIRLARRGHDAIAAKRLVIWTVVDRDLYRYRSPWSLIPLP